MSDKYSLAEARAIIDAEKCVRSEAVLEYPYCSTHDCYWPDGAHCDLRPEVADVAAQLLTNPRDEHHTLAELYEYRMLYNAHAAQGWLAAGIPVVKSLRHSDGELCFGGGWFIVTATLPTGQVSNHYEMSDWWLFRIPTVETAPEWDGHTPQDAAKRLRAAINGEEVTE